jgi:hypothetical protein
LELIRILKEKYRRDVFLASNLVLTFQGEEITRPVLTVPVDGVLTASFSQIFRVAFKIDGTITVTFFGPRDTVTDAKSFIAAEPNIESIASVRLLYRGRELPDAIVLSRLRFAPEEHICVHIPRSSPVILREAPEFTFG